MASVSITKLSAAQRQIDAAIRILFSGEDILAVHTVVAAAHRIVLDLAEKRNLAPYTESIRTTIATLYRQRFEEIIPNHKLQHWTAQFEKKYFRPYLNRPANFLKHADQDAGKVLDQDSIANRHTLAGLVRYVCGTRARVHARDESLLPMASSPFILTRTATRLRPLLVTYMTFHVLISSKSGISCSVTIESRLSYRRSLLAMKLTSVSAGVFVHA